MSMQDWVSTGMEGVDAAIDKLRLGDNVVWQVDLISSYKKVVAPYISQAIADNRKVIYVRFGSHESVLEDAQGITIYRIGAEKGFESFAATVHNMVEKEGRKAFYVFDEERILQVCTAVEGKAPARSDVVTQKLLCR